MERAFFAAKEGHRSGRLFFSVMDNSTTEAQALAEEIADAMVGDVDPQTIDGFQFAKRILPVFRLVRSLFSQNETDTCLKLMILHELTSAGGRWSLERIRAYARFLDPARVEALVRSLKEGSWLDLRESDHTYALSPHGIHLLSILHAADFAQLAPANALARAAQNVAFGTTLQGSAPDSASYLLNQLLVLLDDQIDQARVVLQQARPFRMIEWIRREHRLQLETIQQVLNALQERIDASSTAFYRLVRLHEAMQETVRLHTGIHARLREWNLDRLYTAEAGYSVPELLDAVLGVDDASLWRAFEAGMLQGLSLPPTVTFSDLKERIHGARRKLPSQLEDYTYAPPSLASTEPWQVADLDPAVALRNELAWLFDSRSTADGPLEVETWLDAGALSVASWRITLLARLQAGQRTFPLGDGRTVEARLETPIPRNVAPAALLQWFVENDGLRSAAAGWFSRVQLFLVSDDPTRETTILNTRGPT
jgi:hypothetical protein